MGVMGIVRRVLGRSDPGFEFRQALAAQAVGGDAQQLPGSPAEEAQEQARKIGYLTIDENMINLCASNPSLNPYLLVFSQLNNTINLDKGQESLKRIRLENFSTIMKLTMLPEDYEVNGFEVVEALRFYGHDRISGAKEGWIGHLCTENVRRIEAHTEKKG